MNEDSAAFSSVTALHNEESRTDCAHATITLLLYTTIDQATEKHISPGLADPNTVYRDNLGLPTN